MENEKKELQNKAVDIKGKKYVLVSDRIIFFNENYKNGSIITKLLSAVDNDYIVMQAVVTPDISNPTRIFSAYSQATWNEGFINKTSALENAETSAIGRALGFMGIGVIDSIASVDEINKAQSTQKNPNELLKIKNESINLKFSQIIEKLKLAKTLPEAEKLKPDIKLIYNLLSDDQKNGVQEYFENLK